MRHFTTIGTDQCRNGSSNFLIPYREQPRSTRIVVAYPRPAFSATKRTNNAPINFDQQEVQVSRGHTGRPGGSVGNLETFWSRDTSSSLGAVIRTWIFPRIMPNNKWRTMTSWVHKIRLRGRRGKRTAESFSRLKLRQAPQKEGGEILRDLPPV